MQPWLLVGGIGQLAIAGASLFIPSVLGWREQTRRLEPLTHKVFWTYAAYILCTNLALGFLCCLQPEWLLDGSDLARAVATYGALYWGARFGLQGWYRSSKPPGIAAHLADVAVTIGFAALTIVFGLVALGSR